MYSKTAHGELNMIRTLLATTALATLLAGGAIAQQTTPPTTAPSAAPAESQTQQMVVHAEGHLASNIIGEAVYNSTGDDAEDIGDVSDLVITNEGQIEAIVVGVGGFLGIGQKDVALEFNLAQWTDQPDGERRLVVETTEDALRALPEFDRSAYEPMPADAQVGETTPATEQDLATARTQEEGAEGGETGGETAMAPADSGQEGGEAGGETAMAPADSGQESGEMAADQTEQTGDQAGGATGGAVTTAPATGAGDDQQAQQPADQQAQQEQPADQQTAQDNQMGAGEAATDQTQTGAIDRSNMQQATPDQLTAETLVGTTVYGANEENIGEIGDVALTPEGQVDAVIVDVGGFLGVGEKQVAIGMDDLNFMADEDGDLYLFTNFTQEQLEAQPAYDEASYAENRDEMRLQAQ